VGDADSGGTPGRMGGLAYWNGGFNTFAATGSPADNKIVIDHMAIGDVTNIYNDKDPAQKLLEKALFSQGKVPFYTGQQITMLVGTAGKIITGLEENKKYWVNVTDDGWKVTLHLNQAFAMSGTNPVALKDTGTLCYITGTNVYKAKGNMSEAAVQMLATNMAQNFDGRANLFVTSYDNTITINGFTGWSTQNSTGSVEGVNIKIGRTVGVLITSAGAVVVEPHKYQQNDRIDVINTQYLGKGFLRPFSTVDLPPTHDIKGKTIICEYTMANYAPTAHGVIINAAKA